MNFLWLNELGDDRWQLTRDGSWYSVMPLIAFLNTSNVPSGETWRTAFDSWGGLQPRKYSIERIVALRERGDFYVIVSASMGDWPWPEDLNETCAIA
jgi:hypothetical protein